MHLILSIARLNKTVKRLFFSNFHCFCCLKALILKKNRCFLPIKKGGSYEKVTNLHQRFLSTVSRLVKSKSDKVDDLSIKLIEERLKQGANINAVGPDNLTPLILAAHIPGRNSDELLKVLINKGADVNFQLPEGTNAIMAAVLGNNINALKLLIDAGADLNTTTKSGKTLLDLAKTRNTSIQYELLKALRKQSQK